eukprot:30087-Pelagococcus_subviridis.AAC.11
MKFRATKPALFTGDMHNIVKLSFLYAGACVDWNLQLVFSKSKFPPTTRRTVAPVTGPCMGEISCMHIGPGSKHISSNTLSVLLPFSSSSEGVLAGATHDMSVSVSYVPNRRLQIIVVDGSFEGRHHEIIARARAHREHYVADVLPRGHLTLRERGRHEVSGLVGVAKLASVTARHEIRAVELNDGASDRRASVRVVRSHVERRDVLDIDRAARQSGAVRVRRVRDGYLHDTRRVRRHHTRYGRGRLHHRSLNDAVDVARQDVQRQSVHGRERYARASRGRDVQRDRTRKLWCSHEFERGRASLQTASRNDADRSGPGRRRRRGAQHRRPARARGDGRDRAELARERRVHRVLRGRGRERADVYLDGDATFFPSRRRIHRDRADERRHLEHGRALRRPHLAVVADEVELNHPGRLRVRFADDHRRGDEDRARRGLERTERAVHEASLRGPSFLGQVVPEDVNHRAHVVRDRARVNPLHGRQGREPHRAVTVRVHDLAGDFVSGDPRRGRRPVPERAQPADAVLDGPLERAHADADDLGNATTAFANGTTDTTVAADVTSLAFLKLTADNVLSPKAAAGDTHSSRSALSNFPDSGPIEPNTHALTPSAWNASPCSLKTFPPDSITNDGSIAYTGKCSTYANSTVFSVQRSFDASKLISTETAPSTLAGDSHDTSAELTNTVDEGAADPKPHGRFAREKCVPWTCTTEPPLAAPTLGIVRSTDAGTSYSKSTIARSDGNAYPAPFPVSTPMSIVVKPAGIAGASHVTAAGCLATFGL